MFTQSISTKSAMVLLVLPIILCQLNGCGGFSAGQPEVMRPRLQAAAATGSEGELLVRFKHSIHAGDIQEFHTVYGSKTVKVLSEIGIHVIKLPTGSNVIAILQQMSADQRVEFAELNKQVQVTPARPKTGIAIPTGRR